MSRGKKAAPNEMQQVGARLLRPELERALAAVARSRRSPVGRIARGNGRPRAARGLEAVAVVLVERLDRGLQRRTPRSRDRRGVATVGEAAQLIVDDLA